MTGTAAADFNVVVATKPTVSATASGRVDVTALALDEGDRRLAAADRLEVTGIDAQWPSTVAMAKVRLVRPSVLVERDANGEITLLAAIRRPIPPDVSPDDLDLAPPPSRPWQGQVKVGEVVVEDGRLAWSDAAADRSARFVVEPVRASVRDVAWPLSQPTVLNVSAQPPGGGRVEVTGRVGLAPLTADVRVQARSVDLAPYQAYLPLRAQVRGRADGDLAVVRGREPADVLVRGRAALVRAAVNDGRRSVLTVERAEAGGIDVAWPTRVFVKELRLQRPWALVERDRSGAFPLRALLTPTHAGSSGAPGSPSPPTGGQRPPFSISRLTISDGAARFIDQTVSPPYAEELRTLALTAEGLGTVDAPPARVELTARIGPAAPLAVRGTVGLLGGPLAVALQGQLENFPVSGVNPYLQPYLSWTAREGRFAATVSYRVHGDELTLRNDVHLAGLQLVRAGADDEAKRRVGLPLGLIVALMKNRHGDIDLSLPVGGTLGDPRFDLHDAIWSAVRAVAIKTVTLPVGWIGRIKFSRDSRMEDILIDPAGFEAGRSALTREGQEQVDKIAAFMRESPDVKMVLTPVVSVGDIDALKHAALRAQIEQLATEAHVTPEVAAVRFFRERVPGREPPDTLDEIIAVVAQDAEPPASEATQLATDRVSAVRAALKKPGIEALRFEVNKDAEALESAEGGRVEFGLTDQVRPKRGLLAELLRKLQALMTRVGHPSASPRTR